MGNYILDKTNFKEFVTGDHTRKPVTPIFIIY